MDTKRSSTKFLTFILFFILCGEKVCLGADEVIMCKDNERKSLLSFKQGLIDHDRRLSSWARLEDKKAVAKLVYSYDRLLPSRFLECCNWDGVVCSNRTGHVVRLDLRQLGFRGEIRPALADLHLLSYLDLGDNNFGGNKIPEFIGSFKKLEYLNLAGSNFSGDVPYQLWNLQNLRRLDLSLNSLQGTISEAHLSKLHNLTYLDLSLNSLSLNLTPDWVPPFQLEELSLASCNMGPRFPAWIQTQTKLSHLDLSSNGISSQAPNWLWDQSRGINYLNLSDNQISGSIPLSSNSIVYLDVSSNNFSGHVQLFSPNSYVLRLSGNMFSGSIQSMCRVTYNDLQIFDLSKNQLTGDIPDCWHNMPKLSVLNLADNKFHGHLPHGLGSLNFLQSLIFRNNNLTGELPSSLKNCEHLKLIDVGGNKLTGNVPKWLGELTSNLILSLRHNNFYGSIPAELCRLSRIQVLDLSHNNLSGTIPQCFDNLASLLRESIRVPGGGRVLTRTTAPVNVTTIYLYVNDVMVQWKRLESEYKNTLGLLKLIDLSSNWLVGNIPPEIYRLGVLGSLNLSRNHLTGDINRDIDAMKMLEILDLSKNNLSGEIPTNLAKLHYLSVLDLSDNSLSGKIPEGTQLQSFDASTYAGNMALCGEPLSNCPGDRATRTSANQGYQQESITEEGFNMTRSLFEEYFISAVLGFIVGFWGIIGPICFKRSWRNAYYGYWSKLGDRLYVTVAICKTRFRYTLKFSCHDCSV